MGVQKEIKNITAERIVIGIILNHPEWIIDLNGVIKTDFFFIKFHKLVFYILSSLLQEGSDIIETMDIIARSEKIKDGLETINEHGGMEHIEELKFLAEDYSFEDLKSYSNHIADCSYKRELVKLNEKFNEKLRNNMDISRGEVELEFQKCFQELTNKYSFNQDLDFLGDVFDEVWQELEDMRQDDGVVGLPCFIEIVNRYFTYMNGELIVIGARAKYGKSNWALNEVHNLSVVNGIPVAIFDTEMKTRTFLARLLAIDSGVPVEEIFNGKYKEDYEKSITVEASKKRIREAPIIHKYDSQWDKSKVSNRAKILKLRHNIGLLIYDYIKVKEVGNTGVKEHNELGNWTIFLKDLAGDLDIPILTFGQLSPHERRLADSDKINRYASTIAYLLPKTKEEIARDMGEKNGGADFLYVDYNRNGADHTKDNSKGVNLIYERNICTFSQASYQAINQDEEAS